MKKLLIIIFILCLYKSNTSPAFHLIDTPYIITDKISILKNNNNINSLIEVNCNTTYTLEINLEYVKLNKKGNYNALVTLITPNKRYHKIIEIEVLDKIVYLTFDDGPSSNTIKILDILNKYNIKATFFVTAANKDYKHLIKESYIKGHTIGLHTYTHNYEYIYSSIENYYNDLNKISRYVENITGFKSNIIRFPGGSSNTISKKYNKGIMTILTQDVISKGYQYYDWNLSSGDAEDILVSKETIIRNSTSTPYNKDKDYIILLFHDTETKTTTPEALEDIINYYLSNGYEFRPITKSSYIYHQKALN